MRTTILGFAITVGVLVPAGWHWLDADIEHDGKHLRPLQQELQIDDDVKVTLDVDRSIITTGDTVKATVVAYGPAGTKVTIDLRALHSTNYSGERVERPWSAIDRETIELTAAPKGGKPVSTAIVMGKKPNRLALEDSFRVMITEHKTKIPSRTFYGNDIEVRDFDAVDDKLAAAVSIRGWSGNDLGMKIATKDKIVAGKPFEVTVTLKNTTAHTFGYMPWVDLGTDPSLTTASDEAEPVLDIERIDSPSYDADDEKSNEIPVGKSGVATFRVTPHGALPKRLTFMARSSENDGLGPYGAGAIEVVTFDVAQTKPEADPSNAVASK